MAVEKANCERVEQWRELLATHARTTCELDRELHQHGLGASDFEVLDMLADADSSQRVQELAGRIHLSQSALSRLVARLEKDGLVVRGMCSSDRRGVQVALTDKGRELHARVRPLQRAVLERMLGGASG
ncbi:MarR family winged helix-turn-helix transcriptional regulator [Streptomyces cavernicola]|uniref:MarR family transcriptional regulator n=1 Tax=Streptomyces cavernicola TaxID=3043613 RepID=A0ABT6S9D0_9ACTN|nr:MarR family transcriptional regulator [Streptomyces sp. B-S-A6]MDI3404720.1 MarR family transcriptional regulator [Streptomyces sp. B-S-A6]